MHACMCVWYVRYVCMYVSQQRQEQHARNSNEGTREQPGSREEGPGAARSSQGARKQAKRSQEAGQEQPGSSKEQPGSSKEQPGSSQGQPGTARNQPGSSQEHHLWLQGTPRGSTEGPRSGQDAETSVAAEPFVATKVSIGGPRGGEVLKHRWLPSHLPLHEVALAHQVLKHRWLPSHSAPRGGGGTMPGDPVVGEGVY